MSLTLIGEIATSPDCFAEIAQVIFRKKFDKYLTDERRRLIIDKLQKNTVLFETTITITDCRDPNDNKFLALAVEAGAACIVTGDNDLLVLNPFRDILIISPAEFLRLF